MFCKDVTANSFQYHVEIKDWHSLWVPTVMLIAILLFVTVPISIISFGINRIRKFMLLLLLFIKKCKIIFYCMVRCFTKNNLLSCHFSTLLTLFKSKYHNKYSPFHIVIWQTAILIPRWYVNYFLISIRMYLNMCKANFVLIQFILCWGSLQMML